MQKIILGQNNIFLSFVLTLNLGLRWEVFKVSVEGGAPQSTILHY